MEVRTFSIVVGHHNKNRKMCVTALQTHLHPYTTSSKMAWKDFATLIGLILISLLLLPFILFWSVIGWLLTASPRVCASVAFLCTTFFYGISQLYHNDLLLTALYFMFILLFIFSFQYRSWTRKFKFTFFGSLIIISIGVALGIYRKRANHFRIMIGAIVICASIIILSLTLLHIWLPSSEQAFLREQDTYLSLHCHNKVCTQMLYLFYFSNYRSCNLWLLA
jgi:hypothetical protein